MLKGTIQVPGDKSITHRAIIFASLAATSTVIENALLGDDCWATIHCFRQLGVTIEQIAPTTLRIESPGVAQFQAPNAPLDCQNSGTTARLLMGLLAALPFTTTLIGDESLSRRPMLRVVEPLRQMGADITVSEAGTLPATIRGRALQGVTYASPVASAQVKSAVLLAGLFASGETTVSEPEQSRDHTERFFAQLNLTWRQHSPRKVSVQGGQKLTFPAHYSVPGDISSAAFWLVAASIIPGSDLTLTQVGLNPTRTGILTVLAAMGADVRVELDTHVGEPCGTIHVRASQLQAKTIQGAIIPSLIDELPIIALAATQAVGTTRIADAQELRVKETDRIAQTTTLLTDLGAAITATADGFIIAGPVALQALATYDSYGDHRLAMLLAIAEVMIAQPLTIARKTAYTISYPEFATTLQHVLQ